MRSERRAAPKPDRIPAGAEARHGESCGLALPAEGPEHWLRRGLQGRPTYALDEGQK
jgi:hypothetical protein